jgi:hypothetical protein
MAFMVIREIQAAHELNKEGFLHKKLIFRLFILGTISVVSAAIVIFNILERGLNPAIAIGFSSAGFLFGVWIFYRMNPVKWDEEKELLVVSKIDKWGFVILGIYIVLRIIARFYIEHLYHSVVILTGLTLAMVFGVSFGRLIASLSAIRKAHKEIL